MQQADVAQAIATLQAQGKAVSVQNLRRTLGGGSLRDIIKYRNALLPRWTAAPTEPIPPAPVLVERPLSRCQRCGLHGWFYVEVGRWVCPCGQAYTP
jgi:hypothetical protein